MPSKYNPRHLFIFEGDKGEPNIFQKLEEYFSKGSINITVAYSGNIYDFYKHLSQEENAYTDIVTLLKERNPDNKSKLGELTQEDFEAIYLFFDYDGHDSAASDDKLAEMLTLFNDEHENGYLYINYPMTESFRHYLDYVSFKDQIVKCKINKCEKKDKCKEVEACKKELKYKTRVPLECKPLLQNIKNYTEDVIKELIIAHLSKMNYIVNDIYYLPKQYITQQEIFKKQLEKYINKECPHVAVLSSFPIYLFDYLGAEKIKKKLDIK